MKKGVFKDKKPKLLKNFMISSNDENEIEERGMKQKQVSNHLEKIWVKFVVRNSSYSRSWAPESVSVRPKLTLGCQQTHNLSGQNSASPSSVSKS